MKNGQKMGERDWRFATGIFHKFYQVVICYSEYEQNPSVCSQHIIDAIMMPVHLQGAGTSSAYFTLVSDKIATNKSSY